MRVKSYPHVNRTRTRTREPHRTNSAPAHRGLSFSNILQQQSAIYFVIIKTFYSGKAGRLAGVAQRFFVEKSQQSKTGP